MRTRALAVGLVVVLLSATGAQAWRARCWAEYQHYRIVQTVTAATVPGVEPAVTADTLARTGRAVSLREGGPAIAFEVTCAEGVYSLWPYARRADGQMDGPWPPVYLELTVTRPDGSTEWSRQRVAHQPVYQALTRLFVIAHTPGPYRLSLTLGTHSTAPLLVDFLEVRDELDGCGLTPLKPARTLTDDATLARLRAAATATPAARPAVTHVLAEAADAAAIAALADNVWQSLPPLNALLGGGDRRTPALEALAKQLSKGTFSPAGVFEPWALVDAKAGQRYDATRYREGKPYEGGLPDDGGGFHVPAGQHGVTERALTVAPLAEFFGARLGAVVAEAERRSLDYEQRGDRTSAREAAILLAALADRNPTFANGVQSLSYIAGRAWYQRFGQSSGHPIEGAVLARLYDRVFEAIKDDAELARGLTARLPFVRTPADLRAFFDRNILQYDLQAFLRFERGHMQMGWEQAFVEELLVLGPNPVGQRFANRFLNELCYGDITGNGGYLDYLVNGILRDGCNSIGSSYYTAAVPLNLVAVAANLERLAELGAKVSPFAWDPAVNPRLLQAGAYALHYRPAGGFQTIFGDGGSANDHRFETMPGMIETQGGKVMYSWLFRHTADPRYAWLAKASGRAPAVTAAGWASLEKAAAGARNPVLHAESFCLPAFGCTLLNLGADSAEPLQKAAAVLRFGTGNGHQHGDLLDLTLYAYNQRIVTDGGRADLPNMRFTAQHNTVEVNRTSFQSLNLYSGGYGYPLGMAAVDGAAFMSGGGWASSHPDLDDYRRDVVFVDLGVHATAGRPQRDCYAVDVLRVGGGTVHTYSTHGMSAKQFTLNVPDRAAPDAPADLVFGAADPRQGVTADPLVSTWQSLDAKGAPQHGLRHHLFGWGGLPFYVARGTGGYNRDIPFLWIEKAAKEPLRGSYNAVFEPFWREPNLTAVKPLTVTGGGPGTHGAHAVHVVNRWGRTDTVIVNESGQRISVDGGIETDAHMAVIAEDADGLVMASLTGGTFLTRGPLRLSTGQAAYAGAVESIDVKSLRLRTKPALDKVAAVAGALVVFGRAPHMVGEYVTRNRRGDLQLARSVEIFRSPITAVDEATGGVRPRIALPLTACEPRFYEGCTATNAAHDTFWRVQKTRVTDLWMCLQTPVTEADITDADGDGRRTLRVTRFAPPELTRDPDNLWYGPFHKPVRMRQYNREPFAEPLVLEVTRVDADRRTVWFKPPADYDLIWNLWVYDGTVLTNEAGTRQWRGTYPAREFELLLAGDKPVRERTFAAASVAAGTPKDGQRRLHLYEIGPGDPYRLETYLSVSRTGPGDYRLEANVTGTADLPVGRVTERTTPRPQPVP